MASGLPPQAGDVCRSCTSYPQWRRFAAQRRRTRRGSQVDGFYWLIPRVLAGSRRPGGAGWERPEENHLEEDLRWLRGQSIEAILSMTEEPLDVSAVESHGFAYLHLPVADMTPPNPAQLDDALAFIDRQTGRGRAVLVHCLAGQGRTGTVLAAYLIRSGLSPEQAIAELRLVCPRAVENALQAAALSDYAGRRSWL